MSYRVVYGETMPSWERIFPTRRQAQAFAQNQSRCGDIVFSVEEVVPGEPSQSLTTAIKANDVDGFIERTLVKRGEK